MHRLIIAVFFFASQFSQAQNLINAIKVNDISLAKKLIKKGESVNQTDTNGATALMWAALKSDLKFCKYLVKKGANPKQKGVIYLDSTQNQYYGNLLGICVMNDKYDILEWLVKEHGIDINDREYNKEDNAETGWIPLQFAVYTGNETGIDLLIKLGANKNYTSASDSSNMLLEAINYGNTKLAKKILTMEGVNFLQKNNQGFNALHYAVYLNNIEMVELLLKKGFDVNAQNDSLITPLHASISPYLPHLTKVLVENNADTSLMNKWGETPGFLARYYGYKGVQNILKGNFESLINPCYDSIYELYNKYYNADNDDSMFKYSNLLYQQVGREFYENTGKYGQALNFAGIGFYSAKKYDEALQLFKLSLSHLKKYRLTDTSDRISYLKNIINSYAAKKNWYDSMKIYYNELIPLTRNYKGDTSSDFFEAWRLKLFYMSKTGNDDVVTNEYKKLIRYSDSIGRNNTSAYFSTLNSLVVLYANASNIEKTLSTFDIILKAYKKGPLPSGFDFPHSVKNVCIFLTGESDTQNIKPYLSLYRTLVLKQKPINFNDLYTYSFLKGNYYLNVQKFDSSLLCYTNCIAISRNYASVPENDMAYNYLKSAEVLIKLNRLEEADWFLDTAVSRFYSIADLDPNYFNDINNIQITYYNFLEYKMVLKINPILLRMAQIKSDTTLVLSAMKTKFYAYYKDEQLENAKKISNEILGLEKKFHKNYPVRLIPYLNETAYFYALLKDTASAINYYNQVIQLAAGLPNRDSVQLNINGKIAMIRAENGNRDIAKKWFETEARRIENKGNYTELEQKVLEENINFKRVSGDIEGASLRCQFWITNFKDKDYEKFIEWCIKQGDVYGEVNEFANAERYYKAVENSLLKKYNENDKELVLIHAKLGSIYNRSNQYGLALPYFKKVIEVEEKNGASVADLKSYYNSLKRIYFGINDWAMSEYFSDKLIKINANDIKSDFKNYTKSRTDHVFIKQQLGKYDEAEVVANDLLVKMYKYRQFKNEDRKDIYSMVGAFYNEIGNKEKAVLCVDSAYSITLHSFGNDIEKVSDVTKRKALIYITSGKSAEGLSLLRQNYQALKNKVSDTSDYLNETLNYLGLAYMYRKQLDSAINVLKIVQNNYLSKSVFSTKLTTSLKYSAATYGFKKQYDSAFVLIKLAKNITLKNKGKLEDYWNLYMETANYFTLLKQYDSAKEVLDEILVNQNSLGVTKEVFQKAQLGKAFTLSDIEKYDESYTLMTICMTNDKNNILDKIMFLSAAERENYISSKSNSIRSINRNLIKYLDKAPQFGNIILDNEIFIKGLALETNTKLLQMANSSNDPEMAELLDKIKTGKSKLDNLYTQNNATANETNELENKITAWEKALNKKLGSNFKEDYKKNYAAEIKNKLKPNEVLVDFFSREKINDADNDTIVYYAIVLAKDFKYPKILKVTDDMALGNLFSNSDKVSSAAQLARIYDTRGSKLANTKLVDSRNCYDIVWQKIDSLLGGKKDIYITPSGYLNKIAFAAIKDTNQVYISDKYNIHVLSSSRQILNADNTKAPKKKVGFVLGGIDYDNDSTYAAASVPLTTRSYTFDNDSTRSGFTYLPGTAAETQKIVSYLSDRKYSIKYLTGKQATEEQFKLMQTGNPYFIHLATHGFYLPQSTKNTSTLPGASAKSDNPLLRSGVLLAGGNKAWLGKPIATGKEDGILNSFEISNLDLRQTKFVVLSACETGLGDIKGSEGVFGLQRAFKLAGVEYIINSLWQVPDEQTSELMQNLYFHWAKGVPFEDAFFKAQKTLKAKYEPYYWAAFQLVK